MRRVHGIAIVAGVLAASMMACGSTEEAATDNADQAFALPPCANHGGSAQHSDKNMPSFACGARTFTSLHRTESCVDGYVYAKNYIVFEGEKSVLAERDSVASRRRPGPLMKFMQRKEGALEVLCAAIAPEQIADAGTD